MDSYNGWDMILMDKELLDHVTKEAAKENYIVTARKIPTQDLLREDVFLFMSGAPQAVIWSIIRGRRDTA
jgi:hypothetical protein